MKKKCSLCTNLKDLSEFGLMTSAKDGKQSRCKKCMSDTMRLLYKADPKKKYEQNKSLKDRISKEINEIKTAKGCAACPEKEAVCLDFHHINPNEKDRNVSEWAASKSRNKVLEEIEKCIVACANCHRKHHAGLLNLLDCKL